MKKELLEALSKAQKEMPIVGKNAKGYNYKYADLPTVWRNIKEVLENNGFTIVHEVNEQGVKTIALHEHGELSSTIPFSNAGMKPQDIGSEITYFKRYNLTTIFNVIIEGEDDDAKTANDAKKDTKATPKPQTGTNTCPDCGNPLTMRQNGQGGYCKGVYSKHCPPKPKTESDQKIENEIESWPEPDWSDIPTIKS